MSQNINQHEFEMHTIDRTLEFLRDQIVTVEFQDINSKLSKVWQNQLLRFYDKWMVEGISFCIEEIKSIVLTDDFYPQIIMKG